MNSRDQHFGWIGVLAGLVSVAALHVAPLDALLPLNKVLFTVVCGLMAVWVLVSVIPSGGDKS